MLNPQEIELLRSAGAAHAQGQSGVFMLPAFAANLVANSLLIADPSQIDPNSGMVVHSITPAGQSFLTALASPMPAAPSVTPPPPPAPTGDTQAHQVAQQKPAFASAGGKFERGSGFTAPARPARSTSNSRYDFNSLEIGDYIFVPATPDKPDPKKSLGSTITSVNRRGKDFEPRRFYRTYRAVKGQKFGNIVAPADGAYIVREHPPVLGDEQAATE